MVCAALEPKDNRMSGKQNHKKVVAKCFIAGALANFLFTLVLVAGSSAQDKKFPFPPDLQISEGKRPWPPGFDKVKGSRPQQEVTIAANKADAKSGGNSEAKSTGKVDQKLTGKTAAKIDTKTGGKTDARTGSKTGTKSSSKTTGTAADASARPSVGKVAVWELQQQCKGIKEVNCLISQEAVRIRAEKMNITFLFKAPKWDAYMYNTDTKNYCSFPYQEWKTKGFFSQVMKSKRHEKDRNMNLKVKKTGKTQQIAGQKAMELAIDTPDGERYATIWATPSLKVPKQFSEVIGSLVMVPIKESGAPLRVEVRMRSNVPPRGTHTYTPPKSTSAYTHQRPSSAGAAPLFKIEPVLDTTKAIDRQVDASIFDQPAGYKKVRDEMALLFAEKDDEGADQSMFNFEAEPSSRKKPLPR